MGELHLRVPTLFTDVDALAEGLVERADEAHLLLYGPSGYDEDTWLDFEVLLLDQTIALSGRGRVAASIEGNDAERSEETRFDILLDSLEFVEDTGGIYVRILALREQSDADEETGKIHHEEIPALDDFQEEETRVRTDDYAELVPAEFGASPPPAMGSEDDDLSELETRDADLPPQENLTVEVTADELHLDVADEFHHAAASDEEEVASGELYPGTGQVEMQGEEQPPSLLDTDEERSVSEEVYSAPVEEPHEENHPAFAGPDDESGMPESLTPYGEASHVQEMAPVPEEPQPPQALRAFVMDEGGAALTRPSLKTSAEAFLEPRFDDNVDPRPAGTLFDYSKGDLPAPGGPPRLSLQLQPRVSVNVPQFDDPVEDDFEDRVTQKPVNIESEADFFEE